MTLPCAQGRLSQRLSASNWRNAVVLRGGSLSKWACTGRLVVELKHYATSNPDEKNTEVCKKGWIHRNNQSVSSGILKKHFQRLKYQFAFLLCQLNHYNDDTSFLSIMLPAKMNYFKLGESGSHKKRRKITAGRHVYSPARILKDPKLDIIA